MFNYGSDMGLENNPFEITGMERLVELDAAADFIGKAALRRIKAEGVRRKLVGVELACDRLTSGPLHFWPVESGGRRVGHLTDATHSPRLDKNIGYAWVPIDLAGLGTPLEIEAPFGKVTARVAGLPFYDPAKRIPAK
jgi:aminomethyltransferase